MIVNKLALFLAGCVLASCAYAVKNTMPAGGRADTAQPSIRVIIYFSQPPAADSKQLAGAISEACRCHPVFLRQYNNHALIYAISLPQNHTFASFEKALRAGGLSREIQAVEQDLPMRHQQ